MDKLDYDHPDDPPGNRFGLNHWHKTVPKEAMVEIAERLDVDKSGNKPALRQRIRKAAIGHESQKSANSKLSTSDLFHISCAVTYSQYLDADDVDIYDELPEWGGTLVVNGEEYDVTQKSRGMWQDSWEAEPRYDAYEIYYLDSKRTRLVVIRGRTDQCRYDHSVVLENAVGYGPCKQWLQDESVTEVYVQ
jgi:hypothetical protein